MIVRYEPDYVREMREALEAVHHLWSAAFPECFQADRKTGIGPVWFQVRKALAKAEEARTPKWMATEDKTSA